MSFFRRAMVYLGLVDDDYEDYEPYDDPEPLAAPTLAGGRGLRTPGAGLSGDPNEGLSGIRTLRGDEPSGAVTVQPRPAVVRPIAPVHNAKPHPITPGGFGDAQEIGDRLKEGQPVIVNLQEVPPDLSRRLIDFCSGATYVLGGNMERVAKSVFLLTPANVEVSADDRRRLQERGAFRA
jgi:cell division inhibitor SepF